MAARSRHVLGFTVTEGPILLWDFDEIDKDIFLADADPFMKPIDKVLIEALFLLHRTAAIERDLNEDTRVCSMDAKIVLVKGLAPNWMFGDDMEPIVLRYTKYIYQCLIDDLTDLGAIRL